MLAGLYQSSSSLNAYPKLLRYRKNTYVYIYIPKNKLLVKTCLKVHVSITDVMRFNIKLQNYRWRNHRVSPWGGL